MYFFFKVFERLKLSFIEKQISNVNLMLNKTNQDFQVILKQTYTRNDFGN